MRLSLLLSAACLALITACAHRAPSVSVDRMAELDRHHGFQDLTFNQPCAEQAQMPALRMDGPQGMELAAIQRTARVAPGVQGPVTVGCYDDMLGRVEVGLTSRGAVRRARTELQGLYGPPTTTPAAYETQWRGERVEITLSVTPDGDAAVLSYRSLLIEALWRRDEGMATARPQLAPPDPHPTVFRLSDEGVY